VYDRDTNTEENLRTVLQTYGVTLEQLSETERSAVMSALREMSRDATGKIDEPKPAEMSDTTRGTAADTNQKNSRKETAANSNNSNQVTRAVKGKKEIVIEIAALKGKGYPSPVDLSTGGASKKQTAPSNAPAGRRR
ncbi:MAG: hypothetical protein ICV68_06090, partial [Pyrinomonadaceae bacterium]|nr:hypothetical protein [Pyrinomonadaceae bacterium]